MRDPSFEALLKEIRSLPSRQRVALDQICCGVRNPVVPVPQPLLTKGLVVWNDITGYDVSSYRVHYAWCLSCEEEKA